ncbi:unnamed protein product [Kuraishia capsulata CBS 1993]|uniref:Amino acid permease/ SLC12A domain-containing protein n=1 Tax=Kuraishia capsulata CBS 1993 TaxID=1382522 RepID=W6MU01_9ASCO|nr:uncharacterized protein KUCA_T00001319001 [Kuraishia capsulata CBS 1993]CDK25350.1 unnamed protein product [Kuraishia capsulata CBS 1993]
MSNRDNETSPLLGRSVRNNSLSLDLYDSIPPINDPNTLLNIKEDKSNDSPAESGKLGTLGGVFLPTALNVLSILMFLRFGFIVGQMGILGALLLLVMSYVIDLLTTLSISAIATNGTVKGGGAYYMISRSLGVEFGGAIGVIFYIGQVLNSALNVAGFIEPLMINFNEVGGLFAHVLPVGYWWQFSYCTVFLFLCTSVSLVGAGPVAKAGSFLFAILFIATISVPISTLFVQPFAIPELDSFYSGPSWETFRGNLMPHFTKGAAGSQIMGRETFNDLFGIFFPATAGIFAGASMSGDLSRPSKSIPKGTLWGLLLTFVCYALVIISMGVSIPRDLLHKDVQVIQSVNLSSLLVVLGELSTSLFSVIVGIVGAAKVLQAIARDGILPGLGVFAKGTKINDDPIAAILFTWLLTQVFLFADINQIATFITMSFLMTFIVTNMACFLLKVGSAPNFRPSFKYFNTYTALMGFVASVAAMFVVDGLSATLVVIFLMFLILAIHYVSPPKQWGDVSQSLIYHQVRKYLLKLKQDNVKYWRPQVLLLVDDPRTSWRLMSFCNHLKKGGLYVIGHVMVCKNFQERVGELAKQRQEWTKLRDISDIKAFIQISIAPTLSWGVRNVFLGSGLGGMRPNITVLGFYDLSSYSSPDELPFARNGHRNIESLNPAYNDQVTLNMEHLPTDSCQKEKKLTITEWVQLIEDLLLLNSNVAVAKGFPRLEIPTKKSPELKGQPKYIDLYPIQMSAQIMNESGTKSALTTNFDTYTLILQLGAILNTVPEWKKTHNLRVVVFVEYESDVEDERTRVAALLDVLRIKAEVLVLCLNSGAFQTYNYISKGEEVDESLSSRINHVLEKDEWWKSLSEFREDSKTSKSKFQSFQFNRISSKAVDKFEASNRRRYTLSNMQKLGVSLSMVTNRILNSDIKRTIGDSSDDESDYITDDNESTISTHSTGSYDSSAFIKKKNFKPVSNISSATHLRVPHSRPHLSPMQSSGSIKNQIKSKTSRKLLRSNFSADAMPKSQVFDDATGDQPSIMFVPDVERESRNSRASSVRKSVEEEAVKKSTKLREHSVSKSDASSLNAVDEEDEEDLVFSFNEITSKAQHLILNDVLTQVSSESAVIFSTLPTPAIGTHISEQESLEYIKNLDLWCEGLPPVMLINSKTMTVTTAL